MTPFERLVAEVGRQEPIPNLPDVVAATLKALPRVHAVRDAITPDTVDSFYCCAAQWGGCEGHEGEDPDPRRPTDQILDALAELTRPTIGASR